MAWQIELSSKARKDLGRLDAQVIRRILSFIEERLPKLSDPRSIGEALQGSGRYWRYRVGHYRLIAEIEDDRLCVIIVKIGNRGDIYRR